MAINSRQFKIMTTLLTIVHISVSLFLIIIVLLQHGKGADMGATFGGGSNQTLFGTEGPLPLLNKITTSAAVIFMVTSVALAYISTNKTVSVMKNVEAPVPVEQTVPATEPISVPMPAAQPEGEQAAPEAAQGETAAQ